MGVTLPVWAWYQWEGVRKKPDLRKEGSDKDGSQDRRADPQSS